MLEVTQRVKQRLDRGFTLIEVMIVVAIIAILAAVAIPAYSDYILRSRITDAVTALGNMQAKMEQYYQDQNGTYVGACATGTVAPLPPATPHFQFPPCTGVTANSYTMTAVGQGAMTGFSYSMEFNTPAFPNVVGKKTTAVPTGWTLPTTNCWALKKDGSC